MPALVIAQHAAVKAFCDTRGIGFFNLTEIPRPNPDLFPVKTVTLAASVSAGATNLVVTTPVAPEETYQFADGTKFLVRDVADGSTFTVTTGGPLQSAHASGETATLCGGSLWSGTGNAGATTGWGSSDVYVSSDGVHPTYAGSRAMGYALADLMGF
jgi:hypothetical protein